MSTTTTNLTVAEVCNKVAALQNDAALTTYTVAVQLPYLNMAFDELQEAFELNNIPVTNQTAAVITVTAGTTAINPSAGTGVTTAPNYPVDMVEIQGLYERLAGSDEPFVPMHQREFLPHALDDLPTESLQYWIWQDQRIKFIGALTDREVKIDYIKAIFQADLTASSVIGVINARSFLYYRTAALVAEFVGANKERADGLNVYAGIALDKVVGLGVKGKQAIITRRRPFMSGYKRRSFT